MCIYVVNMISIPRENVTRAACQQYKSVFQETARAIVEQQQEEVRVRVSIRVRFRVGVRIRVRIRIRIRVRVRVGVRGGVRASVCGSPVLRLEFGVVGVALQSGLKEFESLVDV